MIELKEEVGLKEACKILGVGKYTVMRYVNAGLIRVRNVSTPQSSRKKFKFLVEDLDIVRNTYQKGKRLVKPAPKEEDEIEVEPVKLTDEEAEMMLRYLNEREKGLYKSPAI